MSASNPPDHRELLKQRVEQWRIANEFLLEEARSQSLDDKMRALNQLFNTARLLGWTEKLRDGEEEVWARWQELREATLARQSKSR